MPAVYKSSSLQVSKSLKSVSAQLRGCVIVAGNQFNYGLQVSNLETIILSGQLS
jgi:hypothetical protein